jgi:thiaminase/transcriptional activator TenA
MDLFDRLKAAAGADWTAFVDHPFVRQLDLGTLPQAAFQAYLVQDYLFLIQNARTYALAAYKSRTVADIGSAQGALSAIMAEMEMHVRLCARWGVGQAQLEATPEHRTTTAYTRFVLDAGAAGDLLDLYVALAPCTIGYAEIGHRLAPNGLDAASRHPYRDWIGAYASPEYQAVATRARRRLDDLAARLMTEKRFPEVAATFVAGVRLETDFWQAGLASA